MDETTRILVVDDEPELLELLRGLLVPEGYAVYTAPSAKAARQLLKQTAVHLLILDIAMPEEDGISLCRDLRRTSTTPILFLTARSQESDKAEGLEAGGDDFLCKPFSRVELLSRIRALLRRCYEYKTPENLQTIRRGGLLLDRRARTATVDGRDVNLTTTEYAFLQLMAENPGHVFSAQELYESTWTEPYTHASNNTVIVHISNLRRKLGDNPRRPTYIKNVWGRGYYVE